ncbi:DUF4345 domain-containing protein [Marinivivus vitaminiproducens]|uniref:DUF4345 domain-containing protein n=1 Tax=Marinivivus vitaminiproducens TaxID=3035935 RepID=UPI00279F827E|nr:DUF4345 domain-containing protein [Geminicoccaceae bacterium SCSIO 64248]
MTGAAERRALQAAVTVLALVPVGAGLAGALSGAAFLGVPDGTADLDSHVRYLSGLLLAVGIGFWRCVPAIESRGGRFALLTAIVATGGLARLAGVAAEGWPGPAMMFGLVMELAVTPGLYLWQRRIARR